MSLRESRRPVKRRPVTVNPRDPDREREEPAEPLMQGRPAPRECECCGRSFRPESVAVRDATVCTWCVFEETL